MKQDNHKIKIGVIADDFTGGGDAASFLVKKGAKTILLTQIPCKLEFDCDCIVIALKTRSIDAQKAIQQTKEAVDFLRTIGTDCIYLKYCSTFDSTPKGNIGIVLDFLLDYLNLSHTLLCPSLPINGRTVEKGILYVNGVPLSMSSMKNHPLNPMWDSYIPELMREQSVHACTIVERKQLTKVSIKELIEHYSKLEQKFYLIPDYATDEDGKKIANIFKDYPLLSGGSGLLEHLFTGKMKSSTTKKTNNLKQKAIILCGSCSKMTQLQIKRYREFGGLIYAIDSKKVLNGSLTVETVFSYVSGNDQTVLIYSDAVNQDIAELLKSSTFSVESQLIENFMAELSALAIQHQYNKIIVAGGETSGAVTKKLKYQSYQIDKIIAAGVPTLIPLDNPNLKIILKSGNFGSVDFFINALKED